MFWRTNSPKTDFKKQWQHIEELVAIKRDSALKQALLEADKLLDLGLREKKVRGNTLGERLKESRSLFPEDLYQQIWEAHKLRNRLVHENEEILSFQIEKALWSFKRALQRLRFLS